MQIPARRFCVLVFTSILGAFGVVVNPWISSGDQLLLVEVLVAGLWLTVEYCLAARRDRLSQGSVWEHAYDDPPPNRFRHQDISRGAWLVLGMVILLWCFVHRSRWIAPVRMPDDDALFSESSDWRTTMDHLWDPMADHVMIPARLLTFLLMQASDDSTHDAAGAVVTAALFVPALCLLFLIACREWHSEFAGLLAVVLFALTLTYREIIEWYTASCQWLITLHLLFLGMLASYVERGIGGGAALAFGSSFLAPLNFSFGVMIGPLTALWAATRRRHRCSVTVRPVILASIAGSVSGTAILLVLWLNGARGDGLRVDIPKGMILAARIMIDGLWLRNLGLDVVLSKSWHVALFPVVPLCLVLLLRLRPAAWRLLPMLAMIVIGYAWTMPFRAWVDYYPLVTWTRYQLIPQLGLSLQLTGILVLCWPRLSSSQGNRLTLGQGSAVVLFAIFLACIRR